MIISIKNRVVEVIYYIKNRGILLNSLDYDFYDLPIYQNDLEIYDYEK